MLPDKLRRGVGRTRGARRTMRPLTDATMRASSPTALSYLVSCAGCGTELGVVTTDQMMKGELPECPQRCRADDAEDGDDGDELSPDEIRRMTGRYGDDA